MTPENLRLFCDMLSSGDPDLVAHARSRLGDRTCDGVPPQPKWDTPPLKFPDANAYPTIWEQARNLSSSMVAAAASGFAHVDQAEQDRRLTICHGCEFFDPSQGRCTKCGCVARWKAWLASEHCPGGKW